MTIHTTPNLVTGKDSIRYENTVEVEAAVWDLVASFRKEEEGEDGKMTKKTKDDSLFDEVGIGGGG